MDSTSFEALPPTGPVIPGPRRPALVEGEDYFYYGFPHIFSVIANLRAAVGQGVKVFGLDAEWRRGGKLALLQIAYIDPQSGKLVAVLMKFKPWAKNVVIPRILVDFLKCNAHTFVGVGVDGDVKRLCKDYPTTGFVAEDVKCLSVGRMAKRCDVSLNASPALGTLAEKLLNIELDKQEDGSRHSE